MRRRATAAVVVLVLLVFASACGGDDDDGTTPTTTETTPQVAPSTEGSAKVSMLTGLPVDAAIGARPVVAVKIDNVDGKGTPQSGINEADVVYELQVEGSVTRFLALFQSTDAGPIGPVRSARVSEIALLEELHTPLFTWHGENGILGPQVRASPIQARSIDDIGNLFSRDGSRPPAPYDSFVQGSEQIRATADEGTSGPTESIFDFAARGDEPSEQAVAATQVDITFPGGAGGSPVRYDWVDGLWRRSQGGQPHVDTAGEQVAVENVIVRFVDAADSGTRDKSGALVPTAQFIGEGEAWVFSQGTVTVGTWNKTDGASPTRYLDADGEPIGLTPGTTWISVPYTASGSSYR